MKSMAVGCVFLVLFSGCSESDSPKPVKEVPDFILVGQVYDSARFIASNTFYSINRVESDTIPIELEIADSYYTLDLVTIADNEESDIYSQMIIALANNEPIKFLRTEPDGFERYFLKTLAEADTISNEQEFWQFQVHLLFQGKENAAQTIPYIDQGFYVPFKIERGNDRKILGWIKMRLVREGIPIQGLKLISYAWIET